MKNGKVSLAVPYQVGTLTNNTLVRQFDFPFIYNADLDIILIGENDVLMREKYERTIACFTKHTEYAEMFLKKWVEKSSDDDILEFLIDILEADTNVSWSGYRILSSIKPGLNYTFWTFELFYKHPRSHTAVYTGADAPNVMLLKEKNKTTLVK